MSYRAKIGNREFVLANNNSPGVWALPGSQPHRKTKNGTILEQGKKRTATTFQLQHEARRLNLNLTITKVQQ